MTDLQFFFKLIGDKTRFNLIISLAQGEMCVCDLADDLHCEQTLISHHLKKLRNAGLIKDRKVGRWIHCSLDKKKFEKMEKKYLQYFGSENIMEKPCTNHRGCRSA